MADNLFLLRKVLVVASASLYWGSVVLNMYHVRHSIGKFPNIKPKELKEKILWLGWFFVIMGWIGQPFIVDAHGDMGLFYLFPFLLHHIVIIVAVMMLVGGYLGTVWCYHVLGDSWRIAIDKREKLTLVRHGPYRIVRHPIYLFQIIIVAGTLLLLPTPFSLLILFVLVICILLKTGAEERYLASIYGDEYRDYSLHTGRFFPRWRLL